ncbi:hypothetical protein B296_00042492, partial [Ensete ventricosum]
MPLQAQLLPRFKVMTMGKLFLTYNSGNVLPILFLLMIPFLLLCGFFSASQPLLSPQENVSLLLCIYFMLFALFSCHLSSWLFSFRQSKCLNHAMICGAGIGVFLLVRLHCLVHICRKPQSYCRGQLVGPSGHLFIWMPLVK